MKTCFFAALICVCSLTNSFSHQPVMDMAPRWEGGYGFQIRHEYYGSGKLLDGHSSVSNPLDLERFVHKTWLEGVYTFKPSLRMTFKLPYVSQERVTTINNIGVRQKNNGLGDAIIALPLKRYKNKGPNTSNFGITPSLRIPTGSTGGSFPISDGSWDLGLSISYSAEGFPFGTEKHLKIYQFYDLYYWHNNKGKRGMKEGNEIGLDVNLGIHPYHNDETNTGIFLMWDISSRHNETPNRKTQTTASGGTRVQTGPVFVLYRNNIMFRSEYKYPLYENTSRITNSRGHEFNIGIGFTF